MIKADFVDPVILAKLLVTKGVITEEEYDKILQDSRLDYYQGGAV